MPIPANPNQTVSPANRNLARQRVDLRRLYIEQNTMRYFVPVIFTVSTMIYLAGRQLFQLGTGHIWQSFENNFELVLINSSDCDPSKFRLIPKECIELKNDFSFNYFHITVFAIVFSTTAMSFFYCMKRLSNRGSS